MGKNKDKQPTTLEGNLIKVSGSSDVKGVAGCLVRFIKEADNTKKEVELRAVGASAVNQMVKSFAIARGMLAPQGYDLVCNMGFCDTELEGGVTKTAIRMIAFIMR
jgi:stage V sporulation protein S